MCRFQNTSILERACGAINLKNQTELTHLSDVLKTKQLKLNVVEELSKVNDWCELNRATLAFPFLFA